MRVCAVRRALCSVKCRIWTYRPNACRAAFDPAAGVYSPRRSATNCELQQIPEPTLAVCRSTRGADWYMVRVCAVLHARCAV